jgi:adenylate cyclase
VSDRQPLILVVDDNEDNRFTLTQRLRREGYTEVVEAADGHKALRLLAERRFDLVLLDIMMPGSTATRFWSTSSPICRCGISR